MPLTLSSCVLFSDFYRVIEDIGETRKIQVPVVEMLPFEQKQKIHSYKIQG